MAKNFTDFDEVTGKFYGAEYNSEAFAVQGRSTSGTTQDIQGWFYPLYSTQSHASNHYGDGDAPTHEHTFFHLPGVTLYMPTGDTNHGENTDGGYPHYGDEITGADKDMYLVGYESDNPHGERRYTVESVLLAASAYHVGLERVDNESKVEMLDNCTLTGTTSADDMIIKGDLRVDGARTELNTISMATSAFNVDNNGTTIALLIKQRGDDGIARFLDNEDVALDIADGGNVGIGRSAHPVHKLTVNGSISAAGPMTIEHKVNNRDMIQDGGKLDNIQPWADVTCINLNTVSTRLAYLKANATEYQHVTVAKGFDLLEDGDNFKKVPTLSAAGNTKPGIGDYSVQKLKSVEYQADVTGDHSGDITYNMIPDGPWVPDSTLYNTYVKTTSSESIRLTNVRGVSAQLYNTDNIGAGDFPRDITRDDIKMAYQQAYPDFWSTGNETEYRNDVLPTLERTHSNVTAISSRRDAVITEVESNSADWNNVYASVSTTSANWNNVHSSVSTTSANWDSTHTVTHNNSAEWSASVDNINKQNMQAGHAHLSHVNVVDSLTAQTEARLGGSVYVLSAGVWKVGLTKTVDIGGDDLVFVDGILVDHVPSTNNNG